MRGVISARFKNTLLFYGGLELLHGQFKQEETHADTPSSLHSWVLRLLQLLECRQHSAWQEGRVQGIVNLQVTCNIIIWSLLLSV